MINKDIRLLADKYSVKIETIVEFTEKNNFFSQLNKQNESPIKGASLCLILDKNNRVVLAKRPLPNKGWSLPGGRVELNESFEEAAIREIHEEVGVKTRIVDLLSIKNKIFRFEEKEVSIVLAIFLVKIVSGEILETAHAKIENLKVNYFSLGDIDKIDILKTDYEVIKSYLFNKTKK